jgi:hypothetical protein
MTSPWESLKGTRIGFTGTRFKISSQQREHLMGFLVYVNPVEVHYGDCTGADYEMFLMSQALGIHTVCHPPDKHGYRMWTAGDEIRPVKPYLIRNMDIVDESDYLVACPCGEVEQPAGGTWYTVRYARSTGRTVVVVYPGGRVDIQRPSV